jgi:YfiH family protein
LILTSAALSKAGFIHAFSTRAQGNFSPNHDVPEKVEENRRHFLAEVGRNDWPVITLKQTHSDRILIGSSVDAEEGDALLMSEPRHFIGVKTADCVPILVGDPVTKTSAAIHAGWRGTFQRIVEKTIEAMKTRFNARAEDLIAAVGPAACGRCYEVGEDVAADFKSEFSDTRAFLLPSSFAGKFLLNVPAANFTQLIQSGLRVENIDVLPQCTMHQGDLFFSHRKDASTGSAQAGSAGSPREGRQLSIIGHP